MDFDRAARNAKRLIDKNGRTVTFNELASASVVNKPWRGAGVPTDINSCTTKAVFVIGNTSIPTESRGLAFDWVDQDLLKVARHVCLVPALGNPIMDNMKIMVDGGKRWNVLWGQCLQPGTTRILYCFGLKE